MKKLIRFLFLRNALFTHQELSMIENALPYKVDDVWPTIYKNDSRPVEYLEVRKMILQKNLTSINKDYDQTDGWIPVRLQIDKSKLPEYLIKKIDYICEKAIKDLKRGAFKTGWNEHYVEGLEKALGFEKSPI